MPGGMEKETNEQTQTNTQQKQTHKHISIQFEEGDLLHIDKSRVMKRPPGWTEDVEFDAILKQRISEVEGLYFIFICLFYLFIYVMFVYFMLFMLFIYLFVCVFIYS
jgi:hypothetical protein